MTQSPDSAPSAAVGFDVPSPSTDRISGPAGPAMMPFLAIINFATVAASLGFVTVLLPNQLTLLDSENKVSNLALVTSISLLASIVVQPLVGALSDRTRSRWGRRTPWMLAGGLLMSASLSGIGFLQSVALILILACFFQAGSAMLGGPLAALIADRYEINRRGMVSAFIGLGQNLGYAVGVILAAMLAFSLPLAYLTFGAGLAVLVIAFLVINRDRPNNTMQVEPFHFRTFLLGFWINPLKNRDFAWAFTARFLYILAYFVSQSYLFFILTDYIGLDLDGANAEIGVLGIVGLVPAVAAGYATGWLSDKTGRRKIWLYIACVFMGVGYAALIAMPTLPGLYVMTVLTNIAFGMYLASDAVIMTMVLPNVEGAAAKDLGILNLATLLGQSLSAIVAAFAISVFGGYSALLVAGIVIAAIGALAVIPIRNVR